MELKTYAMHEDQSKGRHYTEENLDKSRGLYERDIDRVIHSRAFKRLAGKTQVITGRRSDHHRTRLTHSIEVATLCRSVANHMGLNENLAACLGFSHDLGHPPLGHSGEDVLNDICKAFGDSFEHNRHTLTIVDEFEQKYASFPGLNLSYEVREGIIKHSSSANYSNDESLKEFDFTKNPPLEAQLVDYCDEICYCYSDLDDAIEGRFVKLDIVLEELQEFRKLYEEISRKYVVDDRRLLFNETLRRIMNRTVQDLILTSTLNIEGHHIRTVEDVRNLGDRIIGYSADMQAWISKLKKFLKTNYYMHNKIIQRRMNDMEKIRTLFNFYNKNREKLPKKYQQMISSGTLKAHKIIVYYLAGFTDYYLFQMIEKYNLSV